MTCANIDAAEQQLERDHQAVHFERVHLGVRGRFRVVVVTDCFVPAVATQCHGEHRENVHAQSIRRKAVGNICHLAVHC
jgi:hypothetical protein